jgi:CRISPR-associated protein Cmr6
MKYKNIGLHFYRGYYSDYFGSNGLLRKYADKNDEQQKKAIKKNKEFTEYMDISNKKYFEFQFMNPIQSITLKTAYPGLHTGSGYTFGAGLKGEFQLGFLFDHTTGLPYISGSSIKGAIRSLFPNFTDLGKTTEYQDKRVDFIWEEYFVKLGKGCFTSNFNMEIEATERENIIKRIELEIFEGRKIIKEKGALIKNGIPIEDKEVYYSIYERDIFFDAYISNTVEKGETKGKFLGLDYITPHKNNPLKNPTPLPFLKILPGVRICFSFALYDGYYLTAKGKEFLFKQILLDFGIGAKTNVGYGQFKE